MYLNNKHIQSFSLSPKRKPPPMAVVTYRTPFRLRYDCKFSAVFGGQTTIRRPMGAAARKAAELVE
ncbi:MAG: hypothetical protein A2096_14710 [Spirochaetes bacterium GWF1_41_5]|nr:MAG: hypothetical protein A2096_14710 [Spirochaetes bacterium GWF1_41_5]HBE03647.1 hypothetical protein [Spirochaetia bacterium]